MGGAHCVEQEAAHEFVVKEKGAGFDRFSQVEHTKTVLEIALDEEIADHLGHAKCEKAKAYRAANACNGTAADRWPSEGAQQQ